MLLLLPYPLILYKLFTNPFHAHVLATYISTESLKLYLRILESVLCDRLLVMVLTLCSSLEVPCIYLCKFLCESSMLRALFVISNQDRKTTKISKLRLPVALRYL